MKATGSWPPTEGDVCTTLAFSNPVLYVIDLPVAKRIQAYVNIMYCQVFQDVISGGESKVATAIKICKLNVDEYSADDVFELDGQEAATLSDVLLVTHAI